MFSFSLSLSHSLLFISFRNAVVAIFAALSGQLMFGTEQGGMSSVWNSIFAVLDILMNSTERPLSDDSFFSFFIVAFYLLVNGVMLLIVSQFLVSLLGKLPSRLLPFN